RPMFEALEGRVFMSAVAGDLTGDGIPDILFRNYGTGADKGRNAVWVMGGPNGTTRTNVIELPSATAVDGSGNLVWQAATIADFNGDGNQDILWRNKD